MMKTLPTVLAYALALAAPLTAARAQCTADAGTLIANEVTASPDRDTFFLQAFRDGTYGVPNGFETRYLLTRVDVGADGDDSLTVIQAAPEPFFAVQAFGDYGIHTLIAEISEPDSADFVNSDSLFAPGTPLADVAATFDTLCGDVDLEGARLRVASDTGLRCQDAIEVGSLTPEFTQVIAGGDSVAIRVARDEPAVVPGELELRYVLVRGGTGIVVAVGEDATFVVPSDSSGVYTTHTFIAELTDPGASSYIDPASIVPYATTVDDIVNNYVQNDLCALLDLTGAQTFVQEELDSDRCVSEAGSLEASAKTINMAGDSATLRAKRDEVAFLAEGFELRYVLTEGPERRVVALAEVPSFTVGEAGDYRIHTLVAELTDTSSSAYLDLSSLELGVTPAADVVALAREQDACIDLDLEGATFTVGANELTSSLVDAAPAATAGLTAWQPAAGLLAVRFAPAEALGTEATLTLRDGAGRTVVATRLRGLRAGVETTERLAVGQLDPGFYVVTLQGGGALTSRGVVLH